MNSRWASCPSRRRPSPSLRVLPLEARLRRARRSPLTIGSLVYMMVPSPREDAATLLWRLTDLGVSMTGWGSVQYADLGRATVGTGGAEGPTAGRSRRPRTIRSTRAGSGGHPYISFVAATRGRVPVVAPYPAPHPDAETGPLSLAWKLPDVCAAVEKWGNNGTSQVGG